MIPVRVRFSPCTMSGQRGWAYVVLSAHGALSYLGEGWTAGTRRDAVAMFRQAADKRGWVERDTRTARQLAIA
jgi:hypothetical protein